MKQRILSIVCKALVLSLCVFSFAAYGSDAAKGSIEQSTGSVPIADEVASISTPKKAPMNAVATWLHMLDTDEITEIENSSVLAFAPQVPGDLARVLKNIGGENNGGGFFKILFLSILSIAGGFLVVFAAKRIAKRKATQLEEFLPPGSDGISCFWAGCIRCIPSLMSIVLLALIATIVFLIVSGGVTVEGRMLFQLILGIVLIIQISMLLSRLLFAPRDATVRPFPLNDYVAKALYKAMVISLAMLYSSKMLGRFFYDMGVLEQTLSWVVIIMGTSFIGVLVSLVIFLKTPISASLQVGVEENEGSWIRGQLAAYWHIPAILYLFFAWFFWLGKEMSGSVVRDGSFVTSLFILPIYIVLSYVGRIVISSMVGSLGFGAKIAPDSIKEDDEEALAIAEEAERRKKQIQSKSYLVFRIILATVITTWTLTLWGYDIPFAANAIRAVFESLITLIMALLFWKFASSYIARKIEEATPEPVENAEEDDNEFGGAAPASRSHTLLPMIRKVLASTLVVMVALIIISSLGVNIAPVLAGAGVLGLAIGFGAQKLVSDVLSGFFFLLDDAFRVGEYIQAGSIKGAVEGITLRNVMLRHHRGMLQIVPHSDLGAITNYMRGGIIVKFPLEFPYDTDIDQVRKIIKKVGQAMLLDEELGPDFILPIKSQGVNEITNSVMIIRVKFTSKPGKQFVIKREAFRRITEALNAKGIYYAHRKVIVDFPDDVNKSHMDEETKKKALEAGAAAAMLAEAEQQQAAAATPKEG